MWIISPEHVILTKDFYLILSEASRVLRNTTLWSAEYGLVMIGVID